MKLKTLVKLNNLKVDESKEDQARIYLFDSNIESRKELTATDYFQFKESSILWWKYLTGLEEDSIIVCIEADN